MFPNDYRLGAAAKEAGYRVLDMVFDPQRGKMIIAWYCARCDLARVNPFGPMQ